MKKINIFAIAFLLLAVILGSSFGLLISSDQSSDLSPTFVAYATRTPSPVACSTIPDTYSNWLGINVIGNRTGASFQLVTIYATGMNIRVDIPLNGTAFAEYKVTNSTFETIIVPLPGYFSQGNVLTLALTYTIVGYSPTTSSIFDVPVVQGTIDC
jgi:hypothetical protein